MKLTSFFTVTFAVLATASPLTESLEPRACVSGLNRCNKKASSALGKQCCSGTYCCGVIGSNNVCQAKNTCGE